MAQIFNPNANNQPVGPINNNSPVAGLTSLSNGSAPANEFVPVNKLTSSVASVAPFGSTANDFAFIAADIPDKFGTYESPKLKFLFTVAFFPRKPFSLPETGAQGMKDMMFALKRATRPAPTITYQDANFYSYRTKVAVKMDYGTVTLAFYDDVVNRAHNIVSQYLQFVSPIANMAAGRADSLAGAGGGAASIGLLSNPNGPFQYMRVTHYMLDNNNNAGSSGVPKQVFYDYLNPKIVSVNLDDLDMTQSEANTVEITFVYDSVNITYSDAATVNQASNNGPSTLGSAAGMPLPPNTANPQVGQPPTSIFTNTPNATFSSAPAPSTDDFGGNPNDSFAGNDDDDFGGTNSDDFANADNSTFVSHTVNRSDFE